MTLPHSVEGSPPGTARLRNATRAGISAPPVVAAYSDRAALVCLILELALMLLQNFLRPRQGIFDVREALFVRSLRVSALLPPDHRTTTVVSAAVFPFDAQEMRVDAS